MIRFDLILLPLLGGYLFLITFNRTKFYHQRIDKQRLIFNSSIIAFLLAIVGLSIDTFLLKKHLPYFRSWLGSFNPIKYEGLNQAILISGLGYPFALLLNIFYGNKKSFKYAIEKWGNDYEKLFWTSLNSKNDEGKLLMITTKSNKVYVGYVNRIPDPLNYSHISIIPNFSGYREKETQKFVVTTDYFEILENYIKSDQENIIESKLGIVIAITEIVMVSKFATEIFAQFQNGENSNPVIEEEVTKGKWSEVRENFGKLISSIFSK